MLLCFLHALFLGAITSFVCEAITEIGAQLGGKKQR